MQRARLIPVSGIGSEIEAEQRATSALLAVLSVVRDLSIELLSPLGASRAQRATVDTFTEVRHATVDGRKIQPDGLIRVSYSDSLWSCFVEVKTGENTLDGQQINAYWDLARAEQVDHVLTISNEIASTSGVHPTSGLKVRSNSPVQVSHLSWAAVLTTAIRIKQHRGVSDPEQAWLLGELIRYLEHPASGALTFTDMGKAWVDVRDGARASSLNRRDEGVVDVAGRFDQLLRYAALKLGSQIGEDVAPYVPPSQREPRVRMGDLVESLSTSGVLEGSLRIPKTAGDLTLTADLRAQQLVASVDIQAPDDRGGRARVTWLVNQLREAPDTVIVDSFSRNARSPVSASLGQLREDRNAALGEDRRDPARFRVVMRAPMGSARKYGSKPRGFIDSVLDLMSTFYEAVVQDITPWQPRAPQLKRGAPPSDGSTTTRALPDDEKVMMEVSESANAASTVDKAPMELPPPEPAPSSLGRKDGTGV